MCVAQVVPTSYTLVIAEKPKAAERIAKALGRTIKRRLFGVPIWIVHRSDKTYVIASAAGHLYSLYTNEKGYPVFSYRWAPKYVVDKKSKHTKKFLKVLSTLFRNANEYINACDYDVEGSLIGYLIIQNMGDVEKARRAKFSSLTRQEILNAFNRLLPMDFEMIEAGYCRHVLDWMWGINISRMLMDLYSKAFNARRILSAGRVQTPTLAHAVNIITQKKLHIPIPLIYPVIWIDIGGKEYRVNLIGEPFKSPEDAKHYMDGVRENPFARVVDLEIEAVELQPPHPFNLPDLQSEAYRIYGFTPYRTQKLAEDLYLEALISYPRTNSQKLPQSLDNMEIVKKLAENTKYRKYAEDLLRETGGVLKPNNGVKDDPAHPAIYPTGERFRTSLSEAHEKLYELVVRRYLATFSPAAKIRIARLLLEVNNLKYSITAVKILYSGWLKYYPHTVSEKIIDYEGLRIGSTVPVKRYKLVTRYTRAEGRVNRYSLLKWMESAGIGTESTRAEIIELLYRRGYLIQNSKITDVSDMGVMVTSILERYVPELISIDLTRKFESYLESIKFGKSRCKDIVDEAQKVIMRHIANIKIREKDLIEEVYRYLECRGKESEAKPLHTKCMEKCAVCNRSVAKNGLCVFHYTALEMLKNSYEHWRTLGYDWDSYMEKLLKIHSTGVYVKEVCRYLLTRDRS